MLLATILRGLRSRALLSAGSVLLITLAIGSAVLGPIFQVAVTNSYLVSRLNDAPNDRTGLSWVLRPDSAVSDPQRALTEARAAVDRITGPFAPAHVWLETPRFEALTGQAMLLSAEGECQHLEITGRCPSRPDEILMLAADLDRNLLRIGDKVDLGSQGPKTIVGTYRVPEGAEDFWFDLQRLASIPAFNVPNRPPLPYKPAPLMTTTSAFDSIGNFQVRVDRRLDVPPSTTLDDLDAALTAARHLRSGPERISVGTLLPDTVNDIGSVIQEIRAQQSTAKASITPAVLSLVLVALALLMRLLMAAADLRLPELALASLRGLTSRQLWQLGLAEPLTLLAISLPTGAVLGLVGSWVLTRLWLVPGLPVPLPWESVLAAALVVLSTGAVAVLATGAVLRVSLSEQLTGVRRPRATGRIGVIVQLALVATAIAVLVSKLSAEAPGKPDVTDLILPVLLAVVAGLAATRSTAGLASWFTKRRRRSRSLPAFVAARAISRRQEGTLVILPVTAAIAVCVFGFGVYDSAASWRASVAATSAPAAQVWTSPLPMNQTVALTHEVDPQGRYLMAANQISSLGPTYMVIDSPRLSRVAIWPSQWTPGYTAADVADQIGVPAPIPQLSGHRVGITVDNETETDDLVVRLRLNVLGDRPHYAFLGPFGHGTSTRTQPMPYCQGGCGFEGITLAGPAALTRRINGRVTLSDLTVDGQVDHQAFSGTRWGVASQSDDAGSIVDVSTQGNALTTHVSSGSELVIAQYSSGGVPPALPVARGVEAETGAHQTGAAGRGSTSEFPIDAVVAAQSVPFLGPQGVLIDYTLMNANREVFPQRTPVYVLMRADTPESMIAKLRDHGVSRTTTFEEVRATLDQSAYALALRLYAVVGGLVLLMALAGLFVSTAVQLPARRRDAASLRVVGVPRRSVMSSVLRELAVVLGGTALAGLAAGTLAQYVVLRTVTLGTVDNVQTPALVAQISASRLVVITLASALLFGVVALVSASLTVRGARGATLRENAR